LGLILQELQLVLLAVVKILLLVMRRRHQLVVDYNLL
jgi:hypothetical protein